MVMLREMEAWKLGSRGQGFGQGSGKGTSFIRAACDRDIATVSLGNCPRQAETEADTGLRPALIASVESFKNMGKITWGNADSGVSDRQDDLSSVILMNRDAHPSR